MGLRKDKQLHKARSLRIYRMKRQKLPVRTIVSYFSLQRVTKILFFPMNIASVWDLTVELKYSGWTRINGRNVRQIPISG